jgi:histidine ammonia-lyase
VRSKVPHMDRDRELHKDIEAMSQLIDSGALHAAVKSATA